MRIITGRLKGRTIPFNPRKYGDARTTSGRVKEAAFSMLGPNLDGKRFLDLCAGSGQIGFEAWSRGARVVMNEPDPVRHRLITGLIDTWELADRIRIHAVLAGRLLTALEAEGAAFDIVYLDPPYEARIEEDPAVCWMLSRVGGSPLVSDRCVVTVQHSPRIELPPSPGRLRQVKQRKHGDTVLTLYEADPATPGAGDAREPPLVSTP